ncbi:hypothetical protein GCM10007063_28950 [Lentibacillus kapialis]|uniref:Transposase (putative) YhgA-like domain-containing protein n=1 Tax=Lentibacillus kapialis TaxID=340214 RepID=A0A917Q165_9BACI|nr:hypothetical protein [Lentibacillus kapialis]GGK04845.1 hypothetical protein GCM10007063_28950 [Lentibacillus kapialis]
MFEEFILYFAPDLHNEIDFAQPPDFLKQELYKEIIEEKKGKLVADEIAKVFLKDGTERWILIHIEVQGAAGEDFGERMFRYFYRIYDRFNREVYALALITDREAEHANGFHYSFHGTKVDYTYNVYNFQDQSIAKLEQPPNPFAHAVIAGIYASKTKNDSNMRYVFKRKLMIQILQRFATQQEAPPAYIYLHYSTSLIIYSWFLTIYPDDIIPYIGKEVVQRMQTEKTNTSQTLEEIFAELRQEGRKDALK